MTTGEIPLTPVFLMGFCMGLLFCLWVTDGAGQPRLCAAPYETLLTPDGVICRMPPEAPKPIYYISSADSGITYQCLDKPQVKVNMGVYHG